LSNGIQNQDMEKAVSSLKEKYHSKVICGMDFGHIYSDFD